ncbi:hypothetical protein EDB80DRAFT_816383 [Ilyonectria destructans]|nr:hypothetical protein EDB80DRAFT_816383 [Ilyonectria destructans]
MDMTLFQTNNPPSHGAATNPAASLARPSPNPAFHNSDDTRRSTATHSRATNAAPEEEDENSSRLLQPHIGPDNLQFRPMVLRLWFLICTLCFNGVVIGLLIIIYFKESFHLENGWAYFVIQFLPIIIGTATSSSLEAIIMTFSRITPFMRSAKPEGDFAKDTIFQRFIPLQDVSDALTTRNWLLAVSHFYRFLSYCVQGLKASLLSMDGSDTAEVTHWALYVVSVVYILIEAYIVAVIIYLYCHQATGLREGWDIVTIADHLALFRHSNFLNKFEGSCIADRNSMVDILGSLKLRLGYWRRGGNALWYGFGEVPTDTQSSTTEGGDSCLELSTEKLDKLRYNSVPSITQTPAIILYTVGAILFVAGYIAVFVFGRKDSGYEIKPPVSSDIAQFIFGFVLTTIAVFYLEFWENMKLFAATTEPFVHLHNGGKADETLLLDYTSCHQIIGIYEAMTRKHWKVARSSLLAIIHRALPIIVGASTTIQVDGDESSVLFSVPLSIAIITWMAILVPLIPFEGLESGYSRHLPRDYISIADLISWTCQSNILQADDIDENEKGLLRGNPFDLSVEGPGSEKWHMEAKLRLTDLTYHFDLHEIDSDPNGLSTIGLRSSKDGPGKPMSLRRRLRREKPHLSCEQEEQANEVSHTIAGAKRFKIVDGMEHNVTSNFASTGYTTTTQADNGTDEEAV